MKFVRTHETMRSVWEVVRIVVSAKTDRQKMRAISEKPHFGMGRQGSVPFDEFSFGHASR